VEALAGRPERGEGAMACARPEAEGGGCEEGVMRIGEEVVVERGGDDGRV
jgi:hypothetical protein